MDLRIDYSDFLTPSTIIYDLIQIETDVYIPDFRGEFDSIEKRFNQFKEMFVLAYDGEEIIGYLCYFPISKSLHDELLYQEGFHDDDILPKDVKSFEESSYVYLLSVALLKKYQGLGIGRKMYEAFEAKMKEEVSKGHVIDDIIASVVTDQGENLLVKNGYELIHDYMETDQYKLYKKDGKDL